MTLKSINPANGQVISIVQEMTRHEVALSIDEVHVAYQSWRKLSYSTRSVYMKKAAEILRQNSAEYGRVITLEMGKPFSQAKAEVEKCAWVCEYYAENAESILSDKIIKTDASKSYASYQPLGIVLAVMPWNFPFWQVFRFAAPTLMAGNCGLLKHASNVMGCAKLIEQVFVQAGFPENVFRSLWIGSAMVGDVINHPKVKAVTLTGSTPAGQNVAATARKALKKTVLELGGSDPYVILEDADLDLAANACASGRFLNAGQSCIAAKRFIVVKDVLDRFTEKLLTITKTKKYGDPFTEGIALGPMVNEYSRNELHSQVMTSVAQGARCILGGKIPDMIGAFYPATILTDVTPGMPAFDEELFGPVAVVISAKDESHAIELANQTPFGLGAAVFTADNQRGERIAKYEIESGSCFVNDFVRSDPRLPFGGIKESGYGRELSAEGILEFVNIKTIYIR